MMVDGQFAVNEWSIPKNPELPKNPRVFLSLNPSEKPKTPQNGSNKKTQGIASLVQAPRNRGPGLSPARFDPPETSHDQPWLVVK